MDAFLHNPRVHYSIILWFLLGSPVGALNPTSSSSNCTFSTELNTGQCVCLCLCRHRHPLLLDTQGRFLWRGSVFCGVYGVMPEYEYEALDSSGKLVTGTSSHPNEAFARAN